jgi:hypothetical protein
MQLFRTLLGFLKADGSRPMTGNLAMGGNKVTGAGAPTAGGDLVTKTYGDANYGGGGGGIGDIGGKISSVAGVARATFGPVTWDTSVYDSGGVINIGANPTRLTVPAAQTGKYLLGSTIFFTAGVGTLLGWRKNGVGGSEVVACGGINGLVLSFCLEFSLVAGDYMEIFYSDTGGGVAPGGFAFLRRVA